MKTRIILTHLAWASLSATQAQAATTTLNFNDRLTNISNYWYESPQQGIPLQQLMAPYQNSTPVGGGNNLAIVSPIINGISSTDHIHIGGSASIGDLSPYTHLDTGGIYIDIVDASGANIAFAFISMAIEDRILNSPPFTSHPGYTIRGYKGGINGMNSGGAATNGAFSYVGGELVAETVITEETPLGTFDFLAADSGFGEVDHIEMYFSDYYRINSGEADLLFEFDDVALADVAAVPLPSALWLFGGGLASLSWATTGKNKPRASA